MKTILLFLAISMLTCTVSLAQEMKHFTVKERDAYLNFYPKIDTIPADFINQSYKAHKSIPYFSEIVEEVTKRCLPPGLAQKIIGKRVPTTVYFNATGEIFCLHFMFPKELKSFIREDDLLKIYQGFRAIRIDMSRIDTTPMDRVSRDASDPFKYGTWMFNLGKYAELVIPPSSEKSK